MHPDLHMRNIERLPSATQTLALNAVAKARRHTDLLLLMKAMHTPPKLPTSQKLAFLPVFFSNLDLDMIPGQEQLEKLGHDSRRAREIICAQDIMCAEISLAGLGYFDCLGGDVGISLWPRVWGWFQFIQQYRDHLSGVLLTPAVSFHVDLIRFIRVFRGHPETYDLMWTTPRFWTCILKAWSFLPLIEDYEERKLMLHTLAEFLGSSNARPDSELLAEMVEAAGSVDNLARLVLDFVRSIITLPLSEHAHPVGYLSNILLFVTRAGGCPDGEFDLLFTPRQPLFSALFTLNFEQELLSAILFLCEHADPHTPRLLGTCMLLIRHMVVSSPPNMWLAVLLQRGILRALISVTPRTVSRGSRAETRLHDQVQAFLRDIPTGLVYYYPMLAFKKAFNEIQGSISRATFKDHSLSAEWEKFLASASEFLDALDEFHSPSFLISKACDNLQCGSINESKTMAGRCSGCQAFYYCSRECQKTDWKAGHRNSCHSHKGLLLAEDDDSNLFHRERSFMRTLIHRKYLEERRAICNQQVRVLATHPTDSQTPPILFTLFDFCKSPPVVKVHVVGDLPKRVADLVGSAGAEWADVVRRAERDEGYTQLHGLCVADEAAPRVWVVPLRADVPLIYEGLKALADRVRLGEVREEEEIMREIDHFLDVNVTEIH
ncbi:hypothetical protein FB45DRAFT_1065153 [Roridomyces roridus]|uniref:MYND-type domain-containing protein n=1 Tax=Roridomyces roridus TaxID=1738132 RepID=A0AAD7FAX6_9AGAR|nr:hypothetical protein FB45DRAFT_1065153 [Roridomyces roridus]